MLAELDPTEAFPVDTLGTPRGRQGSPRRVVLPEGWLDDTDGAGCGLAEDARGDLRRLTPADAEARFKCSWSVVLNLWIRRSEVR